MHLIFVFVSKVDFKILLFQKLCSVKQQTVKSRTLILSLLSSEIYVVEISGKYKTRYSTNEAETSSKK